MNIENESMPKAKRGGEYETDESDGGSSEAFEDEDEDGAEDMTFSSDDDKPLEEKPHDPKSSDEDGDTDGDVVDEDAEAEAEIEVEDVEDGDELEAEAETIPNTQRSPRLKRGRGQPRLKITLKIPPKLPSGSNSTEGTITPPVTRPARGRGSRGGRGGRRPAVRKRVLSREQEEQEEEEKDELESEEDNNADVDIESEDSSVDREAAALQSGRLTQRQAALQGGLEVSHVELEEGVSRKKKILNDAELALRREETARKRKNLSEKKLEDEKAETINRLLRKQSSRRSRRKEADASGAATPANKTDVKVGRDSDTEESSTGKTLPEVTTFRWVSNASGITFSVPNVFLSTTTIGSVESNVDENGGQVRMEVDNTSSLHLNTNPHPARPATKCSVKGCKLMKKYRLVKKFDKGACGMEHLKLLESQLRVS